MTFQAILLVPFLSPLSYSGLKMEEARSFEMFISVYQLHDVMFEKTSVDSQVARLNDNNDNKTTAAESDMISLRYVI